MRYFVTDLKPMQAVWYENKALAFSSRNAKGGAPFVRVCPDSDLNPANLLQKFDNSNILYILSDDPEQTFTDFCRPMKCVEAAGGLVENSVGEILMIRRRGWWDLPKGHIEKGETHEQAALREVAEETGLHGVKLLDPLCVTRHFYDTGGNWEMKRTWWFRMRYEGGAPPVPQAEEGITEIKWLKCSGLWRAVNGSYGTIREVFDAWTKTKEE